MLKLFSSLALLMTVTAALGAGSSTHQTYGTFTGTVVSASSNPASAGVIRLANGDLIDFRNAANSSNLTLGVSASNWLQFQGVDLVDKSTAQTLTNKTLTAPVLSSPTGLVKADVGLGNVDNTSDATKNAASVTLTNKTLTAPIISTISNTGTITLPTSTDTLVGRATTDTLTNKTLTSPVINTPTGIVKGDVGLGNVDNTSDATKNAASVTLTNKTISGASNTITNVSLTTGVTGTLPIANGGTGQVTAQAAIDALLPTQTSNSGKVLGTNGTTSSWVTAGTGDVAGQASSVDSEVALFSGTGGKTIKRATGTGVAHLSSGVLSASNVNLASEVTGSLPTANGGNGSYRTEGAKISNGGSCSISSQSNSFISSVSRPSTGQCTITFNSAFSAAPWCTCSADSGSDRFCMVASVSSSSITTIIKNTSATVLDVDHYIVCHGAR